MGKALFFSAIVAFSCLSAWARPPLQRQDGLLSFESWAFNVDNIKWQVVEVPESEKQIDILRFRPADSKRKQSLTLTRQNLHALIAEINNNKGYQETVEEEYDPKLLITKLALSSDNRVNSVFYIKELGDHLHLVYNITIQCKHCKITQEKWFALLSNAKIDDHVIHLHDESQDISLPFVSEITDDQDDFESTDRKEEL